MPDSTDQANAAYWKSLADEEERTAAVVVKQVLPNATRTTPQQGWRDEEDKRRRGLYPICLQVYFLSRTTRSLPRAKVVRFLNVPFRASNFMAVTRIPIS